MLTLNNGVQMPAIGLGVFQTPPEHIYAVEAALAVGCRHIDTAASYMNEHEVGEAIRRSGLNRSEIFVETKVWISDYGYDQPLHAFEKSSAKLGASQLDLLILHQPLPSAVDRTISAYKALERRSRRQMQNTASTHRHGRRSAASRSTAAAGEAPCKTRPSSPSPELTARPRPR